MTHLGGVGVVKAEKKLPTKPIALFLGAVVVFSFVLVVFTYFSGSKTPSTGMAVNPRMESEVKDLKSTVTTTIPQTTTSTTEVYVECESDLECGTNDYTGDYYCRDNYVVRDYVIHVCENPGRGDSHCTELPRVDIIDECGVGKICVEGKPVCETYESCSDGIQNQGETGVDCGGPCGKCDPNKEELAKCLSWKGVTLYCKAGHCSTQEQFFGSAFIYLNVVNCDSDYYRDLCKERDIKGSVTWEYRGEQYAGIKGRNMVIAITRCWT